MARVAICLFLCLFTAATCDNVPVLLFGQSPFKVPALKTLQTDEFTNLVKSQVTDETVTVVFVEPKLNAKDLSGCQASDGVTCFKGLAGLKERSYFPSVMAPVDGLYDNLDSNKATIDQSDDVMKALENGNRVVFVYLEVANTAEDYAEHDKLISETFAKVSQKYTYIVAIYTGQQSSLDSHARSKREVAGTEHKATTKASSPINKEPKACSNFLIAAAQVFVKSGDAAETAADLASCTSTKTDQTLAVTLTPSGLSLKFKQVAGTWSLYGAEKDGKAFRFPAYVYANAGYAYRDSGNFTFKDGAGGYVTIQNTQFMPDFEKAELTIFNKGKYVYGQGFWSPAILAGLFIVFLLLAIMMVGITWIMDINTMDKFDDPKGKTITINANE